MTPEERDNMTPADIAEKDKQWKLTEERLSAHINAVNDPNKAVEMIVMGIPDYITVMLEGVTLETKRGGLRLLKLATAKATSILGKPENHELQMAMIKAQEIILGVPSETEDKVVPFKAPEQMDIMDVILNSPKVIDAPNS
jgi:hypothetical protein